MSPCPWLLPPECGAECPLDHGRHECVLPSLLVLLSLPLLTLEPTDESTVFANFFVFQLRRGASENLFALFQFVLVPAYCALPFPKRREGGRGNWGYRELQTLLGLLYGNPIVTSGYFVRAILEVEFAAISSES